MPASVGTMNGMKYEQEMKLEALFDELRNGFAKLHSLTDAKAQSLLKDLTTKMQEAKTLIKDFEREARVDNLPPLDLATRKKALVQELNGFITAKKEFTQEQAAKSELIGTGMGNTPRASGPGLTPRTKDDMSTQELMQLGRKEIQETDDSLFRAQKLVANTIEVGTKVAETLEGQTHQMEKIQGDLDEIKFTLKKAEKVIRDITRSMATDKCLLSLLALVCVGVVVLIALKVSGVVGKNVTIPTITTSSISGRRLLQLHTTLH